jgi:hypothetical protein
MLVVPKRRATERQRVAFEATELEPSSRECTHVVGAEDDARKIPDCIGQTSFEREEVSLGGPAGMLPPQVPEDSDHWYSLVDGGSHPIIDLLQQGVGWLPTRHGVKAITPPQIVGWEPPSREAGQDARVRHIVSEQHAYLVALQARGEKSRRRVKPLIIVPEEADVVTRRRERIGDAQRNTALARRSTVKAAGPEELEEPGSLPAWYAGRRPHRPVYAPSRYGSSATRTLARARCSSTRTLVS